MKQIDRFKQWSALYGSNAIYVEEMYESYLSDPHSVSEEWAAFFKDFKNDETINVSHAAVKESFKELARIKNQSAAQYTIDPVASEKQAAVLRLIEAYRMRGHQAAELCPVHIRDRQIIPELSPEYHGLSSQDFESEFNTGTLTNVAQMKLKDIIKILNRTYTQSIGAEYMHITKTEERTWIQNQLESVNNNIKFSKEQKIDTLKELISAEGLERYLHTRYVGQKRFSLEGSDALIPLMHELIDESSEEGAEEVIIGMAHRGRLNMLVNILGKAPKDLFDEFEGKRTVERGAGDVKYHMGFSSSIQTKHGDLHLALMFNPSHLEIVDPVTEGSVRARLERRAENLSPLPFNKVLPVLIHGDAAFAGQGVVMETLQLSEVRGYRCGGTVHIIVNNQIGFTTSNPLDVRSSAYSSDVAKLIQAPIFHVNGDDPEAVKFIAELAINYRQKFNKDVVIDLVSYRRLGHNEADEPSATQPMMYKKIKAHQTPAAVYAERLIAEGTITQAEYKAMTKAYRDRLEEGKSVGYPTIPAINDTYTKKWAKFLKDSPKFGTPEQVVPKTAVPASEIKTLAEEMSVLPQGFTLHPRVQKIYEDRIKMAAGAAPIDWGFAENMAYATLLKEGHGVRISGQDSGRGTFFHRHAVYHNQVDGSSYVPLQHINSGARFTVIDSILSEAAVMGFEYGYAATEPDSLVIWEGQFGDFANGAQVVIDQFVSAGETKWMRLCGLTLLLPHGYEGQGPEHSSARPERFLQMCAENNMSVVVPTTPAQTFHLFRRQVLQEYRKPLICFSPKSLLRHKLAVNTLEDLTDGAFQPMIPESKELENKKVDTLVISVGKIYYDLFEMREEKALNSFALVRLEEIYPFPAAQLAEIVATYPNLKEIVFVQDEPRNQGYAFFVRDYLDVHASKKISIRYVTREASASPAVGYNSVHVEQQQQLLQQTFNMSL
ncbi:2-oxoglutarate dehydrogenase E1 component [Wohlfahrtiimonas chitiniclastica]|uniref:oxoglutarate dehydrogenase (succinyl-transferring) n=2 Tax=Wohlfahrtiimonas chitiniclastica TaxID=400946 RepID=L8XZ76_9GAMM|nr:2-oxoglutarate dehydrogenase E1 component [Wohlfahrtiimonas chitiniclastica]ELV08030.1 2-oxoglutarate dehydrogenase E1 component [Wohlfahrtiimonas chitiniclastica SH04]KZS23789.1 2-oxoglutarate dehydrogenase subunit E1 [Wohlfahrtiimonas chitiniclastica]KZX36565.1 2-oxoglutarate dehydrogenase E1 component [Wohlfahrtiimonas chitiniclastica]MBS7816464.1 2-oxoglutarate dehydrogenase E1 component [Wohlfahrtiimonas chitiniclastica]MBS7818399.1 2-oxoglutarate dehydrogenase E1 component [Wohlfahrti